MAYIGAEPDGQGKAQRFTFTASGGETTISVDDNYVPIGYTAGQVSVFLNGVKLVVGTGKDCQATNGSTITGLAALAASDVVEIVALSTFDATTVEGASILSTGVSGTSKYLRVDGDGTSSWQTAGSTNASDLDSGILLDARMPNLTGDVTTVEGAVATTIADNAVTLAKMAGGTDGNLITYDTSGDPAYIATGTSGHVLTSAGADAVPSFQAAASSGINSPWEHIGSWATAANDSAGNVQFRGVFDRYHTMYRLIIPYWKSTTNDDNIYVSYITGDSSKSIDSSTWSTTGLEASAKYRGFSVTEGTDGGTFETGLNYAVHNGTEFPVYLNVAAGNQVNAGIRGYIDFWAPQRADIWRYSSSASVTSDILYYSGGYSFDLYGFESGYETEANRTSGYVSYDLEKDNDDVTGFVIYNESRRTISAHSMLHLLGLKLNLSTS